MGLIQNGIHGMPCLAGILGEKKRPQSSAVSFARTWHSRYASMPAGHHITALILPLSVGGMASGLGLGGHGGAGGGIAGDCRPQAMVSGEALLWGHVTGLKNAPCLIDGAGTIGAAVRGKTRIALDVQIGSRPSAEDVAWAVLDSSEIEGGLTVRQALKLMAAALAGRISGADTTTVRIRSAVADDVERITATVDEHGNRTAIAVDLG